MLASHFFHVNKYNVIIKGSASKLAALLTFITQNYNKVVCILVSHFFRLTNIMCIHVNIKNRLLRHMPLYSGFVSINIEEVVYGLFRYMPLYCDIAFVDKKKCGLLTCTPLYCSFVL